MGRLIRVVLQIRKFKNIFLIPLAGNLKLTNIDNKLVWDGNDELKHFVQDVLRFAPNKCLSHCLSKIL